MQRVRVQRVRAVCSVCEKLQRVREVAACAGTIGQRVPVQRVRAVCSVCEKFVAYTGCPHPCLQRVRDDSGRRGKIDQFLFID